MAFRQREGDAAVFLPPLMLTLQRYMLVLEYLNICLKFIFPFLYLPGGTAVPRIRENSRLMHTHVSMTKAIKLLCCYYSVITDVEKQVIMMLGVVMVARQRVIKQTSCLQSYSERCLFGVTLFL